MIRKTHQWQNWAKLPLAVAVAAGFAAPASAYQFNIGDVEASFDTTLSAGVSVRTANPDKDFISQGNLGPQFVGSHIGASSNNFDDGNLNFDQGDTFSKIVKGTSELLLSYSLDSDVVSRVGSFVRTKYWHDFELLDEDRSRDPVGQRRELSSGGQKNASDFKFLDAYVFADLMLGDTPVTARYGKQVVSWGESTFIQNGINVINPIDVNALRAPGAELKEGLLPVEMLYLSAGLTENITVEAFVQSKFEKTEPDDCGTFFSTNDFAADGCGPVLLAGQLSDSQALQQGVISPRVGDKMPDDADQFGVAVRVFAPDLNQTEFGFFYIRYHSRLPLISGVIADPSNGKTFPSYFVEYPEGINLYGVSMNTTVFDGWSLGGEVSFRDNMPIQWNSFELIFGGLAGNPAQPASLLFQKLTGGDPAIAQSLEGQAVDGFDRFKVVQTQFTLVKFFEQVMGASRLTFVNEVGATMIPNLPNKDIARFGRSGTFGLGTTATPGECEALNINDSNCRTDGFVTRFSWGYRTVLRWEYNNALAGVNLLPQIAWTHDVNGYGPEPGANFQKGRKAIGLTLGAVYLEKYTASIGYTNFFGGGHFNELQDRDFASASISYSF